jgi:hypothetical protein
MHLASARCVDFNIFVSLSLYDAESNKANYFISYLICSLCLCNIILTIIF